MPHAGPGHPRIKQYLNVRSNRRGAARDVVALEGLWAVRTAVDAGVEIEVVFVCASRLPGPAVWDLVHRTDAVVLEVSERVLTRLVDRDGPDGIAALARMPRRALDDVDVGPDARIVIADHLELPGNLGTLARCADGAGATALLLTDRRIRLTHPLVVKASMGTVFSMPVIDADRASALSFLRDHGVRVIAADPSATESYRHADYGGPVAIVVGSERTGLDPFWRAAADATVSIPMLGVADSLNVGHAAALLLYEALWQQRRRATP